ncbi:MAG: hypothetical protein JXB07_17345 [Anaerolineae bacterium]|nr:hypothetical protein [Anaerolineae bacterium]
MTQRVRDWLLLYLLAVLVNGVVAVLVDQPGYMDAYYYFNGAHLIIDGKDWFEPYLWNYVNAPPALPTPAFAYWQPLPSMLAAMGVLLFGRMAAFGSAQMLFVLIAAGLPIVAYEVASQVGERRHALLAGLLTVFSGYYVVRWSLPETFTPFAFAGAGALALAGLGIQKRFWWIWFLAGGCAGLSHLTRADGVLITSTVVFAGLCSPWLNRLSMNDREDTSSPQALAPVWQAGMGFLGYLVVMSPWFWRNLTIFGSLQASGGLSALWLNNYDDLYTYPTDLSPARFLADGWGTILRVKWDALLVNLATFIGVQNLVFLTPLTLIGVWRRWREPLLLPAILYGVALFAAMTFAFSLVGARGGYFHSGGALLPFTFTAAVLGLDDALRPLARWRRWGLEQARRLFRLYMVILAALVTGYVIVTQVVGLPLSGKISWNNSNAVYGEIGAKLDELGVPLSVDVMSNDPPGFYYYTGRGGVPLPNGDEEMLLLAAQDYRIGFLVVDQDVPRGLRTLYDNGPTTPRLELVETYDSGGRLVYLYEIVP